jgi:hypothetical protein
MFGRLCGGAGPALGLAVQLVLYMGHAVLLPQSVPEVIFYARYSLLSSIIKHSIAGVR